jgi:hypothetical protein
MQLTGKHKMVMGVLARDDRIGMSFADLASLGTLDSLEIATIRAELQHAGYSEERREGEPWPGEHQAPETRRPTLPRRRFRLTLRGKAALNS